MKLLTKAIRNKLPPLGSTEGKIDETKVWLKFFDPYGSWTWYAWEFDGDDTFFGLVDGHEKEMGYFSFSELKDLKTPWGHPGRIERDMYWKPVTVVELLKAEGLGSLAESILRR